MDHYLEMMPVRGNLSVLELSVGEVVVGVQEVVEEAPVVKIDSLEHLQCYCCSCSLLRDNVENAVCTVRVCVKGANLEGW